jgi:hypothetical protein
MSDPLGNAVKGIVAQWKAVIYNLYQLTNHGNWNVGNFIRYNN